MTLQPAPSTRTAMGVTWLDSRVALTVGIVVGGAAIGFVAGRVAGRRGGDMFTRYYLRRVVHFIAGLVVAISLAIVWRPFAGRIGLVLGLAAAGLAFAMQEVLGALAGWLAILSGRIYRIGDRIEIGGVRGDVVDITPLRTKVLEIGSVTPPTGSWVRGRQPTGRVVSVSNKQIFTDPVFNFSAGLEFIWEEVMLPVAFESDWHRAIAVMEDEAKRASADTADREIRAFRRRYPLRRADVSPQVFTRATDNYLELTARFPVPVRSARIVRDDVTRRIVERFRDEGIPVASSSADVTLRVPQDGSTPGGR